MTIESSQQLPDALRMRIDRCRKCVVLLTVTRMHLAVLLAMAVHVSLAAAESSPTGMATGNQVAVYTWRIRGPEGEVLRQYRSTFDVGGTETMVWQRDNFYVGGQLIASSGDGTSPDRQTLLYHNDHMGTPRTIFNVTTGAAPVTHKYLPFGEELTAWDDHLPTKFTGQERDTSTLDYMKARYYGAPVGRFMSPDRDPSAWNAYAYAGNDPMEKQDGSGNHEEPFHGGLTYYLALAAGFEERAAARIAIACANIDYYSYTKPTGFANVVKHLLTASASGPPIALPMMPSTMTYGKAEGEDRQPSQWWHFADQAEALTRVMVNLEDGPRMNLVALGAALHTLEDVGFVEAPGPHFYGGEPSLYGIGHGWYVNEDGSKSGLLNHTIDEAYRNPKKNRAEALRIFEVLKQAAASYYGGPRPIYADFATSAINELMAADKGYKIWTFMGGNIVRIHPGENGIRNTYAHWMFDVGRSAFDSSIEN